MTGRARVIAALVMLCGAAASLAGCTVNPATGRQSFTGFLSPASEADIGRQHHGEILEAFGGAYEDPELARYVASVGQLLASTSERASLAFTFTVLDTPIVNALALPGGYVYVTRGLLALADNEAELASVLAHEIGHVAARHTAERYSQAVLANIGLIGVGIATGGAFADALGTGAAAYLQGYSRDQEYEADILGVRYLARAGYQPAAMSSFLAALAAADRLDAELAGRPEAAAAFDIMSSHPRTADRVGRAVAAAGVAAVANPMLERDAYLAQIDGLLYGDAPEQGYVRGRRFLHPAQGFAFEVPPGFHMMNGPGRVIAHGPQDSAIAFDSAPPTDRDMASYLTEDWGRNIALDGVETLEVNGYEAATGIVTVRGGGGETDVRLVAIRFEDGNVYRFVFVTPPAVTQQLALELRRTTYSFRRLDPGEAAALRPQRIAVMTAGPGDTVERLARRMPFEDRREERFRVLNGLVAGERLGPGPVKLIVE